MPLHLSIHLGIYLPIEHSTKILVPKDKYIGQATVSVEDVFTWKFSNVDNPIKFVDNYGRGIDVHASMCVQQCQAIEVRSRL